MLREQTPGDLDALAGILCDPITMSYYPKPFTRDDVGAWIGRNMKSYEVNGFGLWAMVLKGTGVFIGQCGLTLQTIEGAPYVEAGWHVDRGYWRKGYASEAGAAALDLAFDRFGLDEVVSLVLPENAPSAGVARKIGMQVEREVEYKGLRHDLWVTRPG